jgi:leader peptidase (prepilin peptidase)/N-methyltransferase
MTTFVTVVCAVLGLAVGSFLNVVIARVPAKQSIVRPPSHCPNCNAPIRPRDNIPVISWLILRGRCRSCAVPISIRYPLVEVLTAVLFAAIGWRYFDSWVLPAYLVFAAAAVALSMIDIEHFLLPNRIVYPLAIAMPVLLAVAVAGDGSPWSVFGRVVGGAFAGFGAYLVLHLVWPRGMAFGDVKFAFPMSATLAYLGWGEILLGHLLAFLLGSIIGIGAMVLRNKGRRDALPFGPFMASGALITMLWGSSFLHWYLPN